MRKVILFLIKLTLILALPCFILIRGSILLHFGYQLPLWISLILGIMLAAIMLVMSWGAFLKVINKKFTLKSDIVFLCFLISMTYCFYSLFSFNQVKTKTREIHKHYSALHPLLRISLGTLLLVDQEQIITDILRTPKDYALMKILEKKESAHYKQEDGYIHAMDLRTIGRSEVKNFLIHAYFKTLGMNTLRHVGTADHLHVELPKL